MEIRYEKLTKDNLELIKEVQHKIFPESSFEKGYDKLINEGPGDFVLQEYYIAYVDGEPAGTYGLYIPAGVEEHASIWLGWYGILPEYRGKGVGKKILLDSMEKAKEYMSVFPIKYYRLYTSEVTNDSAQPLYNKVMDLKEYYKNEEMFSEANMQKARTEHPELTDDQIKAAIGKAIAIFSKSLDEKEILVPWDSYYMNLMRTVAMETDNTK